MNMNFLTGVKIRKVADAAVSAGTDVASSIIDMAGFESVVFFCSIATANAGNLLKVQQDDVNAAGGMADLEGTGLAAVADGDVVAVEVYRPEKRFVRAVIDRSGAATATGEIYAALINPRAYKVDNNEAGAILSQIVQSPDEGTA